jgi:site-specific recombinase XerD
MLGDYAVHGAVLRRYSRTVDRLAGDGAQTIARFRVWLEDGGCAVSTVRTYATVAGQFVAFLDTRAGTARLDAAGVGAFVSTLAGYQFKTVEQKPCAVRSFLRFASGEGLVGAGVLDAVPSVKSRKQTRIPRSSP